MIGEQPFAPTNWDPAETQQVLTAAIADNPQIDVIVSDFGPSLVGALPEFENSGRSIPAIATSDGNLLACFYEDHKADNPDFELFTISTQNDHARLAIQWAVALATGGETAGRRDLPIECSSRTRSPAQPNPVTCEPDLPGDDLPLRRDVRRRAGRPGRLSPTSIPRRYRRVVARTGTDRGNHRSAELSSMNELSSPSHPEARWSRPVNRRIVLSSISKRYGRCAPSHRRRPRDGRRRGARPARRERCGEVDADERRLGHDRPRRGTIEVDGALVERLTPSTAPQLGIAIVHQHPALLPDMTVAENIRVAVPRFVTLPAGRRVGLAIRRILDEVGFKPHLEDRVDTLSVVDKHLLELAKALVVSPGRAHPRRADRSARPGSRWRCCSATCARSRPPGSAVIYITHRLAEVTRHRRPGDDPARRRGPWRQSASTPSPTTTCSALIIGRRLESAFPPKADASSERRPDPGDRRSRG